MIAVDTNILVYAHRPQSEWHFQARELIRFLAEGRIAWAIPWPCVNEFLSVSTNVRIYREDASPLQIALHQLELWFESPSVHLLAERSGYWPILTRLVTAAKISGPQVHDARIAALCELHGVTELWSADRDFQRFPALRVRNPLISR